MSKCDLEKKEELIKENSVLSSKSYIRYIRPIIEYFKEGLTDKEVLIKILQDNKNLKESSAKVYLRAAKASFREEYILERKFNIIQHVKRYDKDILHLSRYEPRTSSYGASIQEKTVAYLDMVNLLQKKERVLGFHKKMTSIKIKNNINVKIEPVKKTFDFSNLTFNEKIELYNFINKAETNKDEKISLKPNQNKVLNQTSNIEDITHIEVVEDIPNINLLTEKEEKVELFGFDNDSGLSNLIPDKNIIDATNLNKKEVKDLNQIKDSILNNLLKK